MTIYMSGTALAGVEECPHCHRANPAFVKLWDRTPVELGQLGMTGSYRVYQAFRCTTCFGGVLVVSQRLDGSTATNSQQLVVGEIYPSVEEISDAVPERPRRFLRDAQNSLSASSASVMASNSAIDSMLKEKGIGRLSETGKERSLKARIDIAVEQNILTKGMSLWAHRIRLDANSQRHADDDEPMASEEQAKRTLRLAKAIAELLYILPAELPPDEAVG